MDLCRYGGRIYPSLFKCAKARQEIPIRHLLTARRLPTIVRRRREKVHLVHESGLKRRLTVFVCVTLAILFLYNPYLALTPSSSILNVHHSLSYRATVGSSELQHFSPTDARKILALSVATVLSWLDSPANPIVSRVTEISADPARAFELVCSDLWFRPPPAV